MKRKKYFTIVLIATVTLGISLKLLLFTSCSKEGEQPKEKQISMEDLQVENRILNFKEEMQLAKEDELHLKNDSLVDKDTLVWYIEASLNYLFCSLDTMSKITYQDSLDFSLDCNGVYIDYEQLVNTYFSVFEAIQNKNQNCQTSGEKMLLIDVEFLINDLKSNNGILKVSTTISSISSGFLEAFGEYDYWEHMGADASYGGYCDGPFEGTSTDSDAAEQIQNKLMGRISLPSEHSYFTDISTIYIEPGYSYIFEDPQYGCPSFDNPNDETNCDNMYDRLLFHSYSGWPNYHTCLSPVEMNFYLNNLQIIIYDILPDYYAIYLDEKIFATVDLHGDLIANISSTALHRGYVSYGISHSSSQQN